MINGLVTSIKCKKWKSILKLNYSEKEFLSLQRERDYLHFIQVTIPFIRYSICNNVSFNIYFFTRRVPFVEENEFQNRVFLFSNFLGAAILNNCDVSWLLYCSDTKSFCLIRKGQPFHVTIIIDSSAREL